MFLPLLAKIIVEAGWRYSIYTAVAALVVLLVIVAVWMKDHPYMLNALNANRLIIIEFFPYPVLRCLV